MTIKTEKISTGSFDLNKWLYGGYELGVITMIAGPPASGKTNIVLLAACSQAKHGKKVIFIDTEGGFSTDRVKQIVSKESLENVLPNILILNPTSFEDQKKIFEDLLKNVRKNHVSLIVVDGMAMLYRLELGDALQDKKENGNDDRIRKINSEVASQMRILAEIARNENIAVLITNQVYNEFLSYEDKIRGFKPFTNIVGGDLFKYWSKAIIQLDYDASRGKRKAVLLKHRSLPRKEMWFDIKDKGIFRKGWI